jgi:hypothetical protein
MLREGAEHERAKERGRVGHSLLRIIFINLISGTDWEVECNELFCGRPRGAYPTGLPRIKTINPHKIHHADPFLFLLICATARPLVSHFGIDSGVRASLQPPPHSRGAGLVTTRFDVLHYIYDTLRTLALTNRHRYVYFSQGFPINYCHDNPN